MAETWDTRRPKGSRSLADTKQPPSELREDQIVFGVAQRSVPNFKAHRAPTFFLAAPSRARGAAPRAGCPFSTRPPVQSRGQ